MVTMSNEGKRYTLTNNKRVKDAYQRYCDSYMYDLQDAYKTCSYDKQRIFDDYKQGLYATKVISANTFMFTMGGLFDDANGNTYFAYITSTQDVCMLIKEAK